MKKRWIFRILICLVLGVVTTVGVAWGLAWCVDPFHLVAVSDTLPVVSDRSYKFKIDDTANRFRSVQFDMFGGSVGAWAEEEELESQISVTADGYQTQELAPTWQYPPVSLDVDCTCVRGWPAYSVRCQLSANTQTTGPRWFIRDAIEVGTYPKSFNFFPRLLPLRPIFPGFLINTLFYAAIWFILIFGWRSHLRQVRKWQGYCPMCKYDLRGDLNHGCPECGWGREEMR